MPAYYNENDPKTAAWLRQLIKAGLIADGTVDDRSIKEVQPNDLRGFDQCHFFAGIGGWSYALRLAGWSDSQRVWTGSCPCQPFSNAGKRKGVDDERHLWPWFKELIGECDPSVVFGEQVASKNGRQWLSGVFADLETMGYAAAGADLCVAGVGAPHIRQRLYWMAHTKNNGTPNDIQSRELDVVRSGSDCGMEYAESDRLEQWGAESIRGSIAGGCGVSEMVDAVSKGSQKRQEGQRSSNPQHPSIERASPWSDFELIPCRDGKTRRIKSGLEPLAHGVSERVGLLRGYGNAIVPQVAAEFVKACDEAVGGF